MADGQSAVERLLSQGGDGESAGIKELFNVDTTIKRKSLKMKSEVPADMIVMLGGAYTIAGITHSKVLEQFCDNILLLLVSKDRKGRIELLEGIVSANQQELGPE